MAFHGTENQGIISSTPVTINLESEPTNDGDNDNSTNLTVDFGLISTSSLGDYVWEDINGDGIQNDGATGIENVQVILTGTDGSGQQFRDTTYTNSMGFYLFDNLLPGSYEVTFGQPTNFEFTKPNEGSGITQDSLDADADENGLTQTVTLPLNEHNPTLDAGFYQPASLGNYVWLDTNADGIQNDGATGIENIQVILIGTDGLGNAVKDTTYTDGNGFYEFTNLVPGDYAVQFVNPTDFNFSMANLGTGSSQDSLDSDVNPATGLTQTITLVSGENNPTLDAGLYEYASIGDYAWIDTNGDGLQNETNTGIEGIEVILTGTDAFGKDIELITQTDGNGAYLFDELIPGSYKLSFETPKATIITFPNIGVNDSLDSDINTMGMTDIEILESGEHNPTYDAGYFMGAMLGNYTWEDLNANGIQEANEPVISGVEVTLTGRNDLGIQYQLTTETDSNGLYLFPNLNPGTYTVSFTTPTGYVITQQTQGVNDSLDSNIGDLGISGMEVLVSGEYNPTYDAGYYQFASIGDYVWLDTNADGIQNEGDSTGLENIVVNLSRLDGGGNLTNLSTTTDSNGYYLFDNLIPGTYQVSVIPPNDYEISQATQGTNDSLDSNIDTLGLMQSETLISGEHNPTYDAGIYQFASIGNYVWEDLNANGIQDETNTGIEGVTVNITGVNANGDTINLTTKTDANGFYLFDELIPGSYQVSLIPPTGFEITPSNQGNTDSLDSNIDSLGIMMVEILTSGEQNLSYDAGFYQTASIGDYVWVDVNIDGLQNEGDSTGLANVPVFLKGVNGVGDSILLMTTTDANGVYLLDDLSPGEYQISFDIPTQYKVTLQQIGNDSLIDSNTDSLGVAMQEILKSRCSRCL